MKILFASDHAGFDLKNELVEFVRGLGYEVEDMGAYEYNEDDDYPDFIMPLARRVGEADAAGENLIGIILGGSGQGEAMAANRFGGVRAAVYYGGDIEVVRLSRRHNDANTLSLGARFLEKGEAQEAVENWLKTPFSEEERHIRRIDKLDDVS